MADSFRQSYRAFRLYNRQGTYRAIRYGFGGITNLNFPKGDTIVVGVYRIAQKIFKFN